jgi:CBS domain-containing protein
MKAVLCFREKIFTAGEIMSEEKVRREEFKVSGEDLVDKIKELVHEGNIRRILIKDKDDRILLDIPLTFGVLGVLVAPQLAALGALAALVGNATIIVEMAE